MTSLLDRACTFTTTTYWAYLPGPVGGSALTSSLYRFTIATDPKTRREELLFLPIRLVFLFRHSIPAPYLTLERRRTVG
jgi:hypothetical protein